MTIPKRYENVKYEDVPMPVKELLKDLSNKGLYIYGKVGTGKTHIAYSIYKKSNEKMEECLIYNTTELLHGLRQDINKLASDKWNDDQRIMNFPKIVILDDIGSEKISDWVAELFYLVINKRYENMYPTIFTSNLPIKDLAERIGNRTTSRIIEMCNIVELGGEDKRLLNSNKIQI